MRGEKTEEMRGDFKCRCVWCCGPVVRTSFVLPESDVIEQGLRRQPQKSCKICRYSFPGGWGVEGGEGGALVILHVVFM